MKSERARIGMKVRVLDGGRRSSAQGGVGTIGHIYGHPSYAAFEVRFADEASDLFWHYELEEVREIPALATNQEYEEVLNGNYSR